MVNYYGILPRKNPSSGNFLILILLLLLSAVLSPVFSHELNASFQSLTVQGKVIDETGSALPGVSVLEKGTTRGTLTDSDGNFTLQVASQQSVLVFSFVGTNPKEVVVGDVTEFNVTLIADASLLGEVVVMGYGTQERRDVTSSVATVKSEDFNNGLINSPEQLLQGKVAGLNVTSASGEPGTQQAITIRGPGGVRSGSTPLFVVDGMPLDNSSTGGTMNPLNFLNPQDIESIDVLKDASATAIYGTRGANGVVIITTKRGKSGQSSITYSSSLGISNLARKIDVFSASQFRSNVSEIGGTLDDLGGSTDWQEEITRTAYTQNHNITLGGGSDQTTYYVSLGIQDQEGILKNSELQRYSGRINVTQKMLNERLAVDVNLSVSNSRQERPAINDLIGGAVSSNPTIPAYDNNGELYIFPEGFNPLSRLKLFNDYTSTTRILGNISPSFKITKGLEYKMNFGIDNSSSVRDEQWLPSTSPLQEGRLNSSFDNNNNKLVENYLTYSLKLAKHNATFLLGHSYQKIFVQTRWWSIGKFPDNGIDPRYNPGLGQEIILSGENNNKPRGTAVKNELQSFFGKATYDYKDRYLFTGIVRVDGSSKFGDNNKYGVFPSFSMGWRISDEPFMTSLPFSNLKLRVGWGLTGNQEIPSKITQARFMTTVSSSTSYPLYPTGAYPAGTTYSRLYNPDIQWEVSTQTNLGLDFGLMNEAITGSIEYFNKVSNNILLEVAPPDPIQPAPTYWTNIEDMMITNSGVELSLNYRSDVTKALTYSVGGNITFIRNKVEDSPATVIPSGTATGSGLSGIAINGYLNDESVGTFYMLDFIGIDENGENIYRDATVDGEITDKDRVVAGSALPTTLYNFYGKVGFKGFDLTLNFNGVSGNKVYDNTANASFTRSRLAKSSNTTAEAMKYSNESNTNSTTVSTRFLKDGAFLRLNNATLGYNFKPATLGIENWIRSLRLSVTGQNLWLNTDYDGYDPEVNTERNILGVNSYGIDYLSYPKACTIVIGLNITF